MLKLRCIFLDKFSLVFTLEKNIDLKNKKYQGFT
jgi:hypothetical protein